MFTQLYKKIRLLKHKNKEPYSSLYKILGFYPDNVHVYEQAFLHKSSSVEDSDGKWLNNERLEFLGDAVLDAIVADIVYKHFQNKREGFLTNTRSKIVQRETLNRVAVELGLDKMVVYSAKLSSHNNHMYGNALEALIGAIYLDQGYRACYRFINDVIIKRYIDLDNIARKEVNFKSSLIEWSQKKTGVTLADMQIGVGIGYSKKESQQNAAKMAIKKLRTDKTFQQFISDLKKKQTGENTAAHEFEDLPEEESSAEQTSSEPTTINKTACIDATINEEVR